MGSRHCGGNCSDSERRFKKVRRFRYSNATTEKNTSYSIPSDARFTASVPTTRTTRCGRLDWKTAMNSRPILKIGDSDRNFSVRRNTGTSTFAKSGKPRERSWTKTIGRLYGMPKGREACSNRPKIKADRRSHRPKETPIGSQPGPSLRKTGAAGFSNAS